VDVRRCKNQSANTLLGQNNFAATVVCDKRTEQELKAIGWKVTVHWKCKNNQGEMVLDVYLKKSGIKKV